MSSLPPLNESEMFDSFQDFQDELEREEDQTSDQEENNNNEKKSSDKYPAATSTSLYSVFDRVNAIFKSSKANSSNKIINDTKRFGVLSRQLNDHIRSLLGDVEYSSFLTNIDDITQASLKELLRLPVPCVGKRTDNELAAIELVFQSALEKKFTDFKTLGWSGSIKTVSPVFITQRKSIGEHLCRRFNLPSSSFRLLSESLNSTSLNRCVQDETNKDKIPFLVIVSDLAPDVDVLSLKHVATTSNFWLHFQGEFLASLLCTHVPVMLSPVRGCDSFCVGMENWFGLTATSSRANSQSISRYSDRSECWTFFASAATPSDLFLTPPSTSLTLYMFLHLNGRNYIIAMVNRAMELCTQLQSRLRSLRTPLVTYSANRVELYFRYVPVEISQTQTEENSQALKGVLNKLNEQILLDLSHTPSVQNLDLSAVNLSNDETWIEFSPLQSAYADKLSERHLDSLIQAVDTETQLIDSTLNSKKYFSTLVEKKKGLRIVQPKLPFIGLGAVVYIPPWVVTNDLGDELKKEVQQLNSQLARELNQSDSLFSVGVAADESACVCLGVDTKPISEQTLSQYVEKIYAFATKIEQHSQLGKKLEEIVKAGIERAERELTKDEDDQIEQEGLIRQLPVVGSMWNWWQPVEKKAPAGRTFNLISQSLSKVEAASKPQLTPSKSESQLLENSQTQQTQQTQSQTPIVQRTSSTSSQTQPQQPQFETQQNSQTQQVQKTNSSSETQTQTTTTTNTRKYNVIFMLGAPGVGKGTQAVNIANTYGFVHLSAGDLLRAEIKSGSPNGNMIDQMIKDGKIVPSEVTITLLENAMIQSGKNDFLIDGFPRNAENNWAWVKQMGQISNLYFVLFFECPREILEERLLKRAIEQDRKDDNKDSIQKRFTTFENETLPVVQHYESMGKVVRIQGNDSRENVWTAVKKHFDSELGKLQNQQQK